MKKSKDMPYHIGLVLRIYPSTLQKHLIDINDGAQRAVYNRLVAIDKELHSLKRIKIYLEPIAKRIEYLESIKCTAASMKNILPFLDSKEVDSSVVGHAIRNYKQAWENYKTVPHTSIPTFHKKTSSRSYQTDNHYTSDSKNVNDGSIYFCKKNKYVNLPKLGKVRISGSEKMILRVLEHAGETRIATVTVSRDATGRYYISMAIASDRPFFERLGQVGSSVGIDMNLSNFLTDSDGNVVENPRYRRNYMKRIAREERRLALMRERAKVEHRSLRDSKNYQKQRKRVAELQRYAAARTADFEHQISKRMIESQDHIFAEDLKIRNMLGNHKLARAISDVAWSAFFTMLSYKAAAYGRTFMKISPKNTTQTCYSCGYVCSGENRIKLGMDSWTCPECGNINIRDYNAALNIKEKGMALL